MKKVLFTLTIILLLAIFGTSAFLVGNYLMEGKKQRDNFSNLSQMVADAQAKADATKPSQSTTPPANGDPSAPTEPTKPGMLPGYKELYEMNNDVVGWLKMEGTPIDYPVMQTPNSTDYYLRRDFYGDYSTRGCIYAREECDVNTPSDNVTLYGHNMSDGSMFHCLAAYTEKKAWEDNNVIFFDTLTERHTYQIFAVFKTSANLGDGFTYHQFVSANNQEEFDKFVSECKNLAFYETGITPAFGDKLLCLSTCEYTLNNGRLVVAAVRLS